MTAFSKMYYPKLTFASSTIEGIFLFGILCLSNKIYGLDPKISLEVSKSCIWKKPKLASEQHPYLQKNVGTSIQIQLKSYKQNRFNTCYYRKNQLSSSNSKTELTLLRAYLS